MIDSFDATGYSVEDPAKIQGRDEVLRTDRSLARLRLDRALDVLPNTPLDLLLPGSGAGRYARAFARERPDWRIVGGDLSHTAIADAKKIGGGPEYLVFDAEEMPFEEGSFDAVVFFDLLEHMPHPSRLLSESFRVLRAGGTLHFFVPLEDQPGTLYRLCRDDQPIPIHRWKLDHVGHIQRFSDSAVIQLTWDTGFEVQRVQYSFHLIGQLHDFVDYWHRERSRGGDGLLPVSIVDMITRLTFLFTWRLSYIEDQLLHGRSLAAGLHLTAIKR